MHDRDDDNEVRLNGVQQAVRKESREAAPDVLVEDAPSGRRLENAVDRVFDGRDEAPSHLRIAFSVVASRGLELRELFPWNSYLIA